jgi:hypothetical protein
MRQRSIYVTGALLMLAAQACSGGMATDDYSEDDLASSSQELSSQELSVEEAPITLPPKPLPIPRPVPLPDPDAPMCGGIAAFRCPGVGRCVDNPYDDCDPQHGGADCSGLCVCLTPRPGPVSSEMSLLPPGNVCGKGRHFDSSAEVCACVPDQPDPCAVVRCQQGTVCIAAGNRALCVPRPMPEL